MMTYNKFVLDFLVSDIQDRFSVTRKQAETLFWNSVARNVVANEIVDMASYLVETGAYLESGHILSDEN